MKSYLPLSFALILGGALISSCQKESQVPAAQPASLQNANLNTTASFSTLSQSINLGMIDFYPFLGNAHDVSGHGHDAEVFSYGLPPDFTTILPPPALTKNKFGLANQAYKFDGQAGAILANSVFDPSKQVKQFCLYVRYKSNSTGALLSCGSVGDDPGPVFNLSVLPDNSVLFGLSDYFFANGEIGANVSSGPNPTCNNSWIDVVVNYSNSVLTLYVNNKLVATTTDTFPSPVHFSNFLLIGAQAARYPQNFFNSAIDEVRVYNRPITTDEINYLYAH